MLYFPQLMTGSISQYPITYRRLTRTITNALEGGGSIRESDSGAQQIGWELTYSSITTDEWNQIEQLFEASQGRLARFTFLDPTNNLLSWSEDYSKVIWTKDPLLQLTPGIEDPMGGTRAIRITNTAQASQRLSQHMDGPASFQYCFSIYVRSDQTGIIRLLQSAVNGEISQSFSIGSRWTRAVFSGALPAQADGIAFGLELPAGMQVDTFGPQVEAQPGAGKYKKTIDQGGVYTSSRFDQDVMTLTSSGPDQHSSVIRIVSNLGGG